MKSNQRLNRNNEKKTKIFERIREKWIRIANKLKLEINLLDTMVEEYWNLVINQGFG